MNELVSTHVVGSNYWYVP